MSEVSKLSEYLGFEVAYHDGFAYIQEEGTNGVEIKRDASLEERTLWTELKHVSAELAVLKATIEAQGVPDGADATAYRHCHRCGYKSETVVILRAKPALDSGRNCKVAGSCIATESSNCACRERDNGTPNVGAQSPAPQAEKYVPCQHCGKNTASDKPGQWCSCPKQASAVQP